MLKSKNTLTLTFLLWCKLVFSQSLTIVSPATVCSGDAFNTNAVFTGTATVSFNYILGAGLSLVNQSNGQAQIFNYGCGTTAFTCQAIDISNNVLSAITTTVTRSCGSLSIAVSQATLCGAGTLTLTGSGTPSFTWNSGATAASQTLALSQGTIVSLNSNASSCAATTSITVHNLATVQSHSVICPGTSCSLTAAAAPVYNWFQPPGVLVNNGTSGQVVVNPTLLPQTYTVYGFYGGNCILNKTLTLQPYVYKPRSTAPGSVCPSASISPLALGASSFTWSTGTQTIANTGFTASLASPKVYTLTADSSTCNGTTLFSIGIYSLPIVQVNAQNTTICNTQSTTIFASGAATYSWSYAQGLMTNPLSSSVIVQPFATTAYTVLGTSAQGCSSSTAITIQFGIFPAVSIFSTASAVCPGFQSSITANGANQFIWKGSGISGQLISPTITLPAGTYTLVGTNGGSCLDSLSFSIAALPPLQIKVTQSSDYSCTDENGKPWPITFNASGVMSYSWAPFNAAQMTQSVGATTIVSPTTTVCYTLTGYTNTCAGKKVLCVDYRGQCTGINEHVAGKNMLIYPTIVSDRVFIEGDISAIKSISIIDCLGRKIECDEYSTLENKLSVRLPQLPNGTYSILVTTNGARLKQTIIKTQ